MRKTQNRQKLPAIIQHVCVGPIRSLPSGILHNCQTKGQYNVMLASIFDSISTCATLRHVVHTSVFLFLINQYTALPEKTQSILRKKVHCLHRGVWTIWYAIPLTLFTSSSSYTRCRWKCLSPLLGLLWRHKSQTVASCEMTSYLRLSQIKLSTLNRKYLMLRTALNIAITHGISWKTMTTRYLIECLAVLNFVIFKLY